MTEPGNLRKKLDRLYSEALGQPVRWGDPDRESACQELIRRALGDELEAEAAEDVAFHLADWSADAAFLLALHLFPDQLTEDEVSEGLYELLITAPDHLAAAAKQFGQPVQDSYEVGALDHCHAPELAKWLADRRGSTPGDKN